MERFGRYFARLLRLLLGLCALVLVLLALYVSLGRQLAPLLGEYRDDLVAQVHERLGIPVEIGELEGSWQGFGPIITVHDIQLGEGKDALRRYWLAALADRPDLRFELISAICDVEAQTVVVHYVAQAGGKRTRMCEIMRFENGRQVHGEALHGVPAEEGTP